MALTSAWSHGGRMGSSGKAGVLALATVLWSASPGQCADLSEFAALPSTHVALAANWRPPARDPVPVGVVINGEALAEPCLIAIRNGRLFVRRDALNQWSISLPASANDIAIEGQPYALLDGFSGLSASLADNGATLRIDADPTLFPTVHLGRERRSLPVAQALPAQFIGYDLSLTEWNGKVSASAFLDAGFSGGWGMFGTTALAQDTGQGFVRLESAFQRDFPNQRIRLVLGDTLTRGGEWNQPVRFAGVRLGTDFSLAPDDITYPLPVLPGSAALPSVVELAAAGSKRNINVRPGDFTVDYQPVFNGAGQVTMTIRDMTGQARSVTRSFYTSPRLLREGLDDFSLEAGVLRQNFGHRSFSYGELFGAASWRHGMSSGLTFSGRAEGSEDTQAAGFGLGLIIPPLGEFSLSSALSQENGSWGTIWRAQFQRLTTLYTITASYQEESADFAQVGDYSSGAAGRHELAVAGSLNLGRWGSFSVNHAENQQSDGERFSISAVSYDANVGPAYMSLGARRTRFSGNPNNAFFGSLTLPLGPRSSAALLSDDGQITATYNKTAPPDQGLGYRFLVARDRGNDNMRTEGGVIWRTAAGDVDLSAARQGGSGGIRLQANGALLRVDGKIIATPRIDYAFAVVDVMSDQEASLSFENRPVAQRAGNGKSAVISGLQPYAANRIAIDLDALPIDTAITATEQIIVPGYRQAVKVTFGGTPVRPITLLLVDEKGAALQAGLSASPTGDSPGVTGHGGELFLANALPGARIAVTGPEMECEAIVPPLPDGAHTARLGPVPCVAAQKGI